MKSKKKDEYAAPHLIVSMGDNPRINSEEADYLDYMWERHLFVYTKAIERKESQRIQIPHSETYCHKE